MEGSSLGKEQLMSNTGNPKPKRGFPIWNEANAGDAVLTCGKDKRGTALPSRKASARAILAIQ